MPYISWFPALTVVHDDPKRPTLTHNLVPRHQLIFWSKRLSVFTFAQDVQRWLARIICVYLFWLLYIYFHMNMCIYIYIYDIFMLCRTSLTCHWMPCETNPSKFCWDPSGNLAWHARGREIKMGAALKQSRTHSRAKQCTAAEISGTCPGMRGGSADPNAAFPFFLDPTMWQYCVFSSYRIYIYIYIYM